VVAEIRFHPDDTPWDVGHGRAAVGPGWWGLVEQAFAEVDATGATVFRVRQKYCLLNILVRSPEGMAHSQALRARYQRRSARVCEVCGGPAVPVAERIPRPTRTHCAGCERRWRTPGWSLTGRPASSGRAAPGLPDGAGDGFRVHIEKCLHLPSLEEIIPLRTKGTFQPNRYLATVVSAIPYKGDLRCRTGPLLKRRWLGTFHGAVSPEQADSYLEEYVFCFNWRTSMYRGLLFYRVLGQAVATAPAPYHSIVGGKA
jgi:hypothetical protein